MVSNVLASIGSKRARRNLFFPDQRGAHLYLAVGYPLSISNRGFSYYHPEYDILHKTEYLYSLQTEHRALNKIPQYFLRQPTITKSGLVVSCQIDCSGQSVEIRYSFSMSRHTLSPIPTQFEPPTY